MEKTSISSEPIDYLSGISVSNKTKEKFKELSSFSSDPERALICLVDVFKRGPADEEEYASKIDGIISRAKTVLARGGNLLSPEAIDAFIRPAIINQPFDRSGDNFIQMGDDSLQEVADNRRDRLSGASDDSMWMTNEHKKGMHKAISDTARVSGYKNYDDNKGVTKTDQELNQ